MGREVHMKLYEPSKRVCNCEADKTRESAMMKRKGGNPLRSDRAKMIFHYRERDKASFWHWHDDQVREPNL